MRINVDCSCYLETSTHLQETKLKIVVLLSREERDKTLGERDCQFPTHPHISGRPKPLKIAP
jgi:hypothetical protein